MKSRHSEGSISRYTFVEKFGRSLCRNHHLSICWSKVCLTSGRFPEIEHFWEERVRGGKLDFVETMDRRDRLLLLSISRLSTFFNNLSSFLLSNRDVMTPPSRLKEGLITWIGIFPSSWSWLTYFIQSYFMRLSQNFNLIL